MPFGAWVRVIGGPCAQSLTRQRGCKSFEVDGRRVKAYEFYVSPGDHTYSFDLVYHSRIYCNGPLAGKPATASYTQLAFGEFSHTSLLLGKHSVVASAKAGQTIKFVHRADPECKYSLEDFVSIEIDGEGPTQKVFRSTRKFRLKSDAN